jgi:hypothetical protein
MRKPRDVPAIHLVSEDASSTVRNLPTNGKAAVVLVEGDVIHSGGRPG